MDDLTLLCIGLTTAPLQFTRTLDRRSVVAKRLDYDVDTYSGRSGRLVIPPSVLIQASYGFAAVVHVIIPLIAYIFPSIVTCALTVTSVFVVVVSSALSAAHILQQITAAQSTASTSLPATPTAAVPITLWTLVYLYATITSAFAVAYFSFVTVLRPQNVIHGIDNAGGIITVIDCIYFSLAVMSTAGFGDCHAVWFGTRLLVSVELVLSSLLHVLILGRGIDLYITHRAQTQRSNGGQKGE